MFAIAAVPRGTIARQLLARAGVDDVKECLPSFPRRGRLDELLALLNQFIFRWYFYFAGAKDVICVPSMPKADAPDGFSGVMVNRGVGLDIVALIVVAV